MSDSLASEQEDIVEAEMRGQRIGSGIHLPVSVPTSVSPNSTTMPKISTSIRTQQFEEQRKLSFEYDSLNLAKQASGKDSGNK